MESCERVAFITAIACNITKCCSKEEVAELTTIFSYLSATLSATLAFEELEKAGAKKEAEGEAVAEVSEGALGEEVLEEDVEE